MTTVLLTRPLELSESLAEELQAQGFEVLISPMLEYKTLPIDLSDINSYDALVFTSAFAIKCFCEACANRELKVFAVGATSAGQAQEFGFNEVYSAEGDSRDLAKLIKENASRLRVKKLAHICSADTPDNLTESLKQENLQLDKKLAYKAELVDSLEPKVLEAIKGNAIDVVVLLSVRTANNFINLLKNNNLAGKNNLKALCMSKNIVDIVNSYSWQIVRQAENPDIKSVLKELKLINR